MYKSSVFNFWAKFSENTNILYNGISGAIYEFSDEERSIAEKSLESTSNLDGLGNSLFEGGFLVEDSLDEVTYLLNNKTWNCNNQKILEITISPTYECNFRCRYCYTEFAEGIITDKIENTIITFLEKEIPKYDQTNINWFGGEPLLCSSAIKRMSEKIKHIGDVHKKIVLLFLTSNGYLLTHQKAKVFFESGIRYFHFTIDGDPKCHDSNRVLANGKSTYKKIFNNLLSILKTLPGAHLTLRMNISESNIDSIFTTLDTIPHQFRNRVQLNITPIILPDEVIHPELLTKINKSIRYGIEHGFSYFDSQIGHERSSFCNANKLNNFQLGPDGRVYKCSPTDKPEVFVGKLNEDGSIILNENYLKWHSNDGFSDGCKSCIYLCFCLGGCRLNNLRDFTEKSCKIKFEDIDNMIINKYLAVQNENSSKSN